tara:strand:+ start:142 stop:255 length:114 start_codon:yes stop_codon:yes gene_type:complete
MNSWVLDMYVLLNAAMFLVAFGRYWACSRKNDSGEQG